MLRARKITKQKIFCLPSVRMYLGVGGGEVTSIAGRTRAERILFCGEAFGPGVTVLPHQKHRSPNTSAHPPSLSCAFEKIKSRSDKQFFRTLDSSNPQNTPYRSGVEKLRLVYVTQTKGEKEKPIKTMRRTKEITEFLSLK